MNGLNRRHWMAGAAALAMGTGFARAAGAASLYPEAPLYPESRAADIVRRIALPDIPERDIRVADFGGKGDGQTDNTGAIAQAIAACVAAGGGRVVLPQGVCLTGPVRLRSRVELHVPEGTRLKFIPEPERYLPPVLTRWEGVELMGYQPLIYAFEESDIAVTGGGVIDGSADDRTWWPWKGPWNGRFADVPLGEQQAADRQKLFDMAEQGVPVSERVFGAGNRLRPAFFQPYRCQRVLFEGLTVEASPFWLLHPVLCTSVTFRQVTCDSHGPNNDGCDPESCVDVLIEGCTFRTGDDCIAIKAGRNADGRRIGKACEHIVIRNCHMEDGHGGIAIGSEMTGGVRNVFVQDCTFDSPHLGRAIVLKSNSYRGGDIADIHFTRLKVGQVDTAFLQIWMQYEEGDGGPFIPSVNHVTVSDTQIATTGRVLVLRGTQAKPIAGLALSHVTVHEEKAPSVVLETEAIGLEQVTVAGKAWTQAYMDRLPGLESVRCDRWGMCR